MTEKRKVIGISIGAYLLSLFLPSVQRIDGSYAYGWEMLTDGLVGVFFGITLLVHLELTPLLHVSPWFANILWFLCLIQVELDLFNKWMILPVLTVLFMAGYVFNPVVLCNGFGVETELSTPVYGYYLWVISGIILLIYSIFKWRTRKDDFN